ncbi:DUF4998 domain-containing protein [Niabella sp. CC-SYL272]|uniref:DUF4998 domain-containing protein n=1 Tax=Niabella agricola TaxID=2891571 RepID=UPI001F2DE719|nr:DUF4998 domain-containing protein [Niabella agricola]MCF3110804.1 DUF4998 domain-containing protein [Niabella agricola]
MSNKLYILLFLCTVLILSCGKMYDNLEKYAGETVYPGRFDTIIGRVGFERVEINLMKAGRIPASQIKLGKAMKTIVEYDDKKITIDTLASWLNIKDLKVSKLYRFKIYTIDENGNKSVPQQIGLIPYTETDVANLVIPSPQALTSPAAAILTWPTGLSSAVLTYYGLQYSYKDKTGAAKEGERAQNPRVLMSNLAPGTPAAIDINYKIIPRVNGTPILDTVWVPRKIQISIPTSSTPFAPAEAAILTANGITTFTADGVAPVQKLTFPVHTTTLQDIFYFPNLKELDLTGGTIFEMTKNSYNRNGVTDVIGGGPIVPFARRVGDMPLSSTQYLLDLLDLGTLTKVKYIANSMGIDNLLAPYVSSGVVEIVDKPDEFLVPLQPFLLDGVIQDANWKLDVQAPAATYPAGTDLQNVVKATVRAKNGTLVIQLPKEYEFDMTQYKNLKFKVYAPNKSVLSGTYAPYQRLWLRIMNYLWAFGTESSFGQQYWEYGKDANKINDSELEKWTDKTIDLSQSVGKHNRVIVINIGGEPSLTFAPSQDITYYFANFRFSK